MLKSIVGALAAPQTLALVIGLTAGVAHAFRRRSCARVMMVAAVLIAWSTATAPIAQALITPLESQYQAMSDQASTPGAIVVLGSGYRPRDAVPTAAALDHDGLVRVLEGLRLARSLPGARLILSGGALPGRVPAADGYGKMAEESGIPAASITLLRSPLDTAEEAEATARLLGSEPFFLVTSAYHMPRAMWLMRRAGTSPRPAPTGQRAGLGPAGWRGLLPNSRSLATSERALHEYVALAALRVGMQ